MFDESRVERVPRGQPTLREKLRRLLYKKRDVTPEEARELSRRARLRQWGYG